MQHCVRCPYSELFWSAFSRIRTEYGEIVFLRIQSKCGKIITNDMVQNNSEYGHFSRSAVLGNSSSKKLLKKDNFFKVLIGIISYWVILRIKRLSSKCSVATLAK